MNRLRIKPLWPITNNGCLFLSEWELRMSNRSIVYVDGFNLYYGAIKHTRGRKWLDLWKFFRRLRPDDDGKEDE